MDREGSAPPWRSQPSYPCEVYSLKMRRVVAGTADAGWQRVDAGVSPAVLVRKGGKGVRAPATEVPAPAAP